MDSLQLFLDRFRPSCEAESVWLKNIYTFITQHLNPGTHGPTPSADGQSSAACEHGVYQLSVDVVQKVLEKTCIAHSLPVSYRPVSISELISQQRLACVSNLSWSTNQQRAWAKEVELSLPGKQVLPRVYLLLFGWLREGDGGEWKLMDSSGSIRCELISPSRLWLDRPIFLPHWNYIPHDALGQDEDSGYVELIGSPVMLCHGAEQGVAAGEGAGLVGAVSVSEAAGFLRNRVKGWRASVYGQVGSVCPLLVVAGTTFFFFTLRDDKHTLPVLVKDSRLWWSRYVCVGQSVCVTALRMCVLRAWRGNNILCVTECSDIQTEYTHAEQQTYAQFTQPVTHTPAERAQADSPLPTDYEEAEPEEDPAQLAVRMKHSRVISYQGTVTEVVNDGAGLYVLDRKVGLCVAYLPSARRKLRVGDRVELHHVHFLYHPSSDFSPSMLCCCLRTTLRVMTFSRVGGCPPSRCCPGDGVLPQLLLQNNAGLDQYLWTSHLSSQLCNSLVPGLLKQQCVCLLSWKLMETLWRRRRRGHRDIYSEMLDEPHNCPLTQYYVDPSVPQYLSVSDLLQSLQSTSWSSVSLRSLLPPDESVLTRIQINLALSWSCRTLSSDPQTGDSLRPRPLLLIGVIQLPSQTSEFKQTLQLRDATGAVGCVVTETSEDDGGQRSFFNTAFIGCLVCVHQFTIVTERFLRSDFPSYQHLDKDGFITSKHCRVYLQFSLDHIHILSPSAAMVTHLRQKEKDPEGDATVKKQTAEEEEEEEEEEGAVKKRRREDGDSSSSSATTTTGPLGGDLHTCVSMVIRVEQKEGVAWRNTGEGITDEKAGLQLWFSVRAAVIGPPVCWGQDPKNKPMMDLEAEPENKEKVLLAFSGVSARWFPVLQSGCFYRLVGANTQDPSVLIGCGVSVRSEVELHTSSTLLVRSDWRFHTLTRPLLLPTCRQVVSPPVLSVSQVLDSSSELVCFQGLISERISVGNRTTEPRHAHTGVRLTLCDQTGQSLRVYLDLSHTPYPPGLFPGNTVLLSGFQRKLSRSGGVYCCYSPVSSITVTSLGDPRCAPLPPTPRMHLGQWAVSEKQGCFIGQVKGHVVCILLLHLQWSCSQCGSLYSLGCSSLCGSTSSVFQSKAKLVIDDGTGEAHVWFSGGLVQTLLGFTNSQWEGLQRALRVRGHIRILPRGQSQVCDSDSDDVLLHFLLCICTSDVVCRPISFTCRKLTNQRSEEVRRFCRGDRDFLTRLTRPLQLTCVHLDTDPSTAAHLCPPGH